MALLLLPHSPPGSFVSSSSRMDAHSLQHSPTKNYSEHLSKVEVHWPLISSVIHLKKKHHLPKSKARPLVDSWAAGVRSYKICTISLHIRNAALRGSHPQGCVLKAAPQNEECPLTTTPRISRFCWVSDPANSYPKIQLDVLSPNHLPARPRPMSRESWRGSRRAKPWIAAYLCAEPRTACLV